MNVRYNRMQIWTHTHLQQHEVAFFVYLTCTGDVKYLKIIRTARDSLDHKVISLAGTASVMVMLNYTAAHSAALMTMMFGIACMYIESYDTHTVP